MKNHVQKTLVYGCRMNTFVRVKGGAMYLKAIVSGGQNGRFLSRHYRLGPKEKSLEKSSKYLRTMLA